MSAEQRAELANRVGEKCAFEALSAMAKTLPEELDPELVAAAGAFGQACARLLMKRIGALDPPNPSANG